MEESDGGLAGSTYRGSFLFSTVAKTAGLPIDQFNFLLSEIIALILAIGFRTILPPNPKNVVARHLTATILGVMLGFFCYGIELWHIVAQSLISYGLIFILPSNYSHLIVFIFCMIYMSVVHIHRLIYDYGNYTLDISGPLMINTQKLTAFAFAFYDGFRSQRTEGKSKLTNDQDKQKIVQIPNLLEYFSFIFYFQGIIVGPLCFYHDYIHFITGENLKNFKQPSIVRPVIFKLLHCSFWAGILLFWTPKYTVDYNLSEAMIKASWIHRLAYLQFSTFCTRAKYYFAFILAEVVNNASGLGFAGYDEKNHNEERWDLLTNVKPFDLEMGTSLKTIIDSWNIQTGLWLRRVCYDRLKSGRTLGVFVLSAVWHGFYPGYYICFIFASVVTAAGRGIRRRIRPYFQKNTYTVMIYALITWIGAQIILNFTVVPFVLLEVEKSWRFHQSWYFSVPILTIIIALMFDGSSTKKNN